MPQYRTMGLPKLTGHTDKDIKNLRDLFYQQDEQLRYLFEHLGTDIASEIWENDNQSVKIKIDEDGIIAEIRESLDGDLQRLSTKINIAAGKVSTTVSRVENIERNYVSDDTLAGILSEYVTDDDIDTVYLSLKTEIDENAEAIALRATKEYVAESLNGYVTEAELSAELKISSDGVLTTVSKNYATTGAVNSAQNTANAAGAAAATAQDTANSAKNTADAVAANLSNNYYSKTTVDQKFDGITLKYTDSAGNETSFKLTNGAIDITLLKNQVDDAAKTATNFISMTSDGGVEVGNKSGGNWTGYRSQMLADRFCIVDDSDNELASYEANAIYLGKSENKDTVIDFNNGMVTLIYDADYDRATMNANDLLIQSETGKDVGLHSAETTKDGYFTIKNIGSIYVNKNGAHMSGNQGDEYGIDLFTSIDLGSDGVGIWESVGIGGDGHPRNNSITMSPFVLKIRGQSTGVSWYMGRDYALLASTNAATASTYFPVVDCKAQTGDWSMGCLGDSLYFVFTQDSNYSAGNNVVNKLGVRYDGMPLLGGSTPLIEYGTWTPTIYNRSGSNPTVTYKNRSGYYYRIGNMVYVIAYISPVISANSGNYAAVRGLPFTSYGVQQGLGVFEGYNVFNHGNSAYHVTARVMSGTDDVYFYSPTGSASLNWIVNSGETTYNPNLRFSGWYRIE